MLLRQQAPKELLLPPSHPRRAVQNNSALYDADYLRTLREDRPLAEFFWLAMRPFSTYRQGSVSGLLSNARLHLARSSVS